MFELSTLIGIDSSTSNTGISVFMNGRLKGYELISLDKKGTTQWERLKPMITRILGILNKFKPDTVYIEDSWKGRNVDTLKCLTNIIGAVRGWCIDNNADFTTLMPSQWRKVLGLNKFQSGREELKDMAKQYIVDTYHIKVPKDDVSDCICIGLAGVEIERTKDDNK